MFELKDRVAIVTGGARGIGEGISRALAAQGAKVVIADLIMEEAEKNVSEIESGGGTSMAVQTDVTDLEQVRAMVDKVRETYGPVDILVNNAGWDRIELFMKTTPAVGAMKAKWYLSQPSMFRSTFTLMSADSKSFLICRVRSRIAPSSSPR